MATILPIDELNALEQRLKVHFDADGHIKSRKDCEDIIDELLDLFLLAYANGVESVNKVAPRQFSPTTDDVQSVVYERIDGATWVDRVWGHYSADGTLGDILNIARTEAHRDAEEAAYNAAERTGAKTSTWHCSMLRTSRDSHVYLDGVTVPMGGYFYSYRGGKTRYPGQWGDPEEDCNCLCWLTFEW